MKNYRTILSALVFSAATFGANAQSTDSVATESRDAASAYMGTTNFVVGRLGRECLSLLGRSETPKEFVAAWQQRNAKFYSASMKYMVKRLDTALAAGGEKARDAVAIEYGTAVRRDGEGSVADWFSKGNKEDVCKRAVSLIDSGAMDVSPKVPIYGELEALAKWAEAN